MKIKNLIKKTIMSSMVVGIFVIEFNYYNLSNKNSNTVRLDGDLKYNSPVIDGTSGNDKHKISRNIP